MARVAAEHLGGELAEAIEQHGRVEQGDHFAPDARQRRGDLRLLLLRAIQLGGFDGDGHLARDAFQEIDLLLIESRTGGAHGHQRAQHPTADRQRYGDQPLHTKMCQRLARHPLLIVDIVHQHRLSARQLIDHRYVGRKFQGHRVRHQRRGNPVMSDQSEGIARRIKVVGDDPLTGQRGGGALLHAFQDFAELQASH